MLIVEDDFVSRKTLQYLIKPYGSSEIAVDGEEALAAFNLALNQEEPYDVIFLDIMMPGIDGQEVLKEIRKIEAENNIEGLERVKIIMTTALDDKKTIMKAFHSECEGYLVKPVSNDKLVSLLKTLALIE